MIDLIINNTTPLDLSKDARIRIEKARGREGSIEAEKTFSSDLPASPKNIRELGMLTEPSAKKNLKRIPASINKDGKPIIEGLLNLKSADDKKISYQIDSNFSAFKQKIRGKTLRDTLEGLSYTFALENTLYKYFFTQLPAIIYIPAYELLIDAVVVASTPVNFQENILEELARQANESANAIGYRFYSNGQFLTTMPIVDSSPALVELRYTNLASTVINVTATDIIESICLIDNYDYTDFVFPRMSNPKFYGEKVDFSGKINEWDAVNSKMRNNSIRLLKNEYSVIPMLRLKFMLDKIFEFAGATWEGFFDEPEQDLILYNNFELARYYDTTFKDLEPLPFNRYSEEMEYKNHVPDIEIEAFLLNIAYLFNLEIEVTSTNFKFSRRVALLASVPHWLNAPYKVIKSTFAAKKDYTLSYQDNQFDFFADYVQTDPDASDTEEIKFNVGTLRYDASYNAIADEEGSTQLFSEYFKLLPADPILWLEPPTFKPCPLRLLYWKGLQSGQPTATAKPIVGYDNNLLLDDLAGIRQYWENWLTFLNETETVNLVIWLTAGHISAFNIFGTIQLNHLKLYPLKLGVDLGNKGVQRGASLEAYIIH